MERLRTPEEDLLALAEAADEQQLEDAYLEVEDDD